MSMLRKWGKACFICDIEGCNSHAKFQTSLEKVFRVWIFFVANWCAHEMSAGRTKPFVPPFVRPLVHPSSTTSAHRPTRSSTRLHPKPATHRNLAGSVDCDERGSIRLARERLRIDTATAQRRQRAEAQLRGALRRGEAGGCAGRVRGRGARGLRRSWGGAGVEAWYKWRWVGEACGEGGTLVSDVD